MERRELLGLMGRAATAGVLTSTLGRLPAVVSPAPVGANSEAIEAAASVARSYRRLWSTTPTEDLRDLVLGHLRLVSRLLASTSSEKDQARLAAAASDTALLAAWLAQDSWDLGAVQRHYQEATTYAERSGDHQSFAACSMSEWAAWGTGSGAEAVRLVQQAKGLLPRNAPSAAFTYMAAHEATAYATAHDEPAMSSALIDAEKSLEKTDGPNEAPWP